MKIWISLLDNQLKNLWSLGKFDNSVLFLLLLIGLSSPCQQGYKSHYCCDLAKPYLLFTNLLIYSRYTITALMKCYELKIEIKIEIETIRTVSYL